VEATFEKMTLMLVATPGMIARPRRLRIPPSERIRSGPDLSYLSTIAAWQLTLRLDFSKT
jgi:hypothetical protein